MLDPARHQTTNSFQLSNGVGNRIRGYGSWEGTTNSGSWASKQLDESGICSPSLWTTSPPRSPQLDKNYHQSLSPTSRTQAIARGQKELMEMVRNMPESSYELTLKDLVEKPVDEVGEENEIEERNLINKNVYRTESSRGSGRKVDQTAMAKTGGNFYNEGFYLKMMFPTSLGSKKKKKKKKKSDTSGNDSSKVSPRPSMSEGSLKGGFDKEWWTKSASASVDYESGVNGGSTKSSGSSSSGSSSRSNSRRERSIRGCWFLLVGRPKSLTQE